MDTQLNRRIRDFFDGLAADWDATVCPEHAGRLAAILEQLAIPVDARVLDVGSGTGVLLPHLSRHRTTRASIIAVDLSFNMMRAASARMDTAPGTICCVQSDAAALPFGEAAFDWVICNSVFPHFLDQHGCVGELARVLRPGGRLAVCHSQSRDTINGFHSSRGGLIGGHFLPDAAGMARIMAHAGLWVASLEDAIDRYLLVAVKR